MIANFEEEYLKLREKEGRLYNDTTVALLPDVDSSHPLKSEWDIRKRSAQKLLRYLQSVNPNHKVILEVGCGNGWLANKLASLPFSNVIGTDINQTELLQATRVFKNRSNLRFIAGEIENIQLESKADFIILASSIQYFADLDSLFRTLFALLSDNGEIHIIDSPLYQVGKVESARIRSIKYFESNDSPLKNHYHHHTWDSFKRIGFNTLYNPSALQEKIKSIFYKQSPFPWLVFKNR